MVYEPSGSPPGSVNPVAHSGEHPRIPLGVPVGVGAGGEVVIATLTVGAAPVEEPLHPVASRAPKAQSAVSNFALPITPAITPSLGTLCRSGRLARSREHEDVEKLGVGSGT